MLERLLAMVLSAVQDDSRPVSGIENEDISLLMVLLSSRRSRLVLLSYIVTLRLHSRFKLCSKCEGRSFENLAVASSVGVARGDASALATWLAAAVKFGWCAMFGLRLPPDTGRAI